MKYITSLCFSTAILSLILLKNASAEDAKNNVGAFVSEEVAPKQKSLRMQRDSEQPLAASVDAWGGQSDFTTEHVILYTDNSNDLQRFVARFGGVVLRSDAIPPELAHGANLPAELTSPRSYLVKIDLIRKQLNSLGSRMTALEMQGTLRFSSELGLRTFSSIIDATLEGFRVSADFIYFPQQAANQEIPGTTFQTGEGSRPGGGATSTAYDGFTEQRFGASGDQAEANLREAWQFVAAHGIKRPVRIAVLDDGFYLDPAGFARNRDTDFRSPPDRPLQFDAVYNSGSAGGVNEGSCTDGTCSWHGSGSAGVAAGLMNNSLGTVGTGALVAEPILIRTALNKFSEAYGVRMALAMGADVISMSFGANCNYWCRHPFYSTDGMLDFKEEPGAIVVAAAGNDGKSVEDNDGWMRPCTLDWVVCVGALEDNSKTKWSRSNFGYRVHIYAPTNIPIMSLPDRNVSPQLGDTSLDKPQTFGGTSASTPFVAGVVALMKAINPDLRFNDISAILTNTGHLGIDGMGGTIKTLDALAAVRAAAANIPIVPDHLGGRVRNFGAVESSANERNLNVDQLKSQVFHFETKRASSVDVLVERSNLLPPVRVTSFRDESDSCPSSTPAGQSDAILTPPADPGATKRQTTWKYNVSGGRHTFVVKGDGVNAYNIALSIVPAKIDPDRFEVNDAAEDATSLGSGEVSIDATLHTKPSGAAADIDFYDVVAPANTIASNRGVGYDVKTYTGVSLSANQSPISLSVFGRGSDGAIGPLLASINLEACSKKPAVIALDEGKEYKFKITGEPGS
ncbi:S8/S53 family peptidase, partial [Nostoc sp. NIES-2111]